MSIILPVFDLVAQRWLPNSCDVTYRNTLLGYLYPDTEFAIGDVSSKLSEEDVNLKEVASLLDRGFEGYELVGASGARKHGRAIYAKNNVDCFTRFFGSNMNAINYGSNLTTECKKIVTLQVKLLVVEDDDETYGVGDCHGKLDAQLAHTLADSTSTPIQFRAASLNPSWIAKGTLAYSYKVSRSKYDIVLPTSCFKGNKVAPGEYTQELVLGVVFTSEVRRVNMSYSVTQFFPWSAVEADILPATRKAAQHLNQLSSNIKALAFYLVKANDDEEEDEKETEYMSMLAQVIAHDKYGQLLTHPWVVTRVADLFRRRWLRLATAGAIRFNSSMVMPDESLPDNCCYIPGLPDGEEVIVFPYPCRWKHDIKIWRNTYVETWEKMEGVFVVNTKTALKLGRDYDGDYIMWLPTSHLPNIAAAVREFVEPVDQGSIKPKKIPLTGTLGEIAVRSMKNDTGLITWLIAKSWALGKEGCVNQLVPQLQAAVDSLKGAAPPDQALLDRISGAILKDNVSWLKEYKENSPYLTRPISEDGRTDTVSRLVKEVNSLWIPLSFKQSNLRCFTFLFPEPEKAWLERAILRIDQYNKGMTQVNSTANIYAYQGRVIPKYVAEGCKRNRRQVLANTSTLLDKCNPKQKFKAVSAFWHAKHTCNSTDQASATIVFLVGLDEICRQLQELQITTIPLYSKQWTDYPDHSFSGELMGLKLVSVKNPVTQQDCYAAFTQDSKVLGCLLVNQCPPILLDIWFESFLYTRYDKKNMPSRVDAVVSNEF